LESRASDLRRPALSWLITVIAGASAVAVVSARPYASGWNDGSRLATVESLVDERTFAIDRSIFVQPSFADPAGGAPYYPAAPAGTFDKIFVSGHFYSDKSPVPAIGMAAIYAALQQTTGIVARQQPAAFCYWMTLLTSGTSYVAAVVAVFLLQFAF
jgi:hypothetical protein